MKERKLYEMRRDYSPSPLEYASLEREPIDQFAKWFDQALKYEEIEVNSMVVATANREFQPTLRVVLLKSYSQKGFIFFTNYLSRKGCDIEENPKVALLFFWPTTMRQVRLEGVAKKLSREDSLEYFHSRPIESQASSALSKQSKPLLEREQFEREIINLIAAKEEIEMPLEWGGYRVEVESYEFWQGGMGRSHDRFLYSRAGVSESWKIERLYP